MPAADVLCPAARRTLLSAMACAAAADGDVSAEEQAALRGAQVALGLVQDRLPLPAPVLERLDFEPLSRSERMLVLAAAVWIALADGVRSRSESHLLGRLCACLGLDDRDARFMAAHARWTRTSTEVPWHREVEALLVEGARRIEQMERALAA